MRDRAEEGIAQRVPSVDQLDRSRRPSTLGANIAPPTAAERQCAGKGLLPPAAEVGQAPDEGMLT